LSAIFLTTALKRFYDAYSEYLPPEFLLAMKVAHLSHTDDGAGAGRAAYRIHSSLRELGVDSRMLVSEKRTADPSVQAMSGTGLCHWRSRVPEYLEARAGRSLARDASVFLSPARYGYFEPAREAVVREADVVATYWINGAFISPESLVAIDKPLLWRLSDVWPFTGGCHYPGSCKRFESMCGECPQLRQPGKEDAAYRLWQRKRNAWSTLDLTVVAPSNWMAVMARRSSLFANRRVEVIPTGVDLKRYRPADRSAARARFGLPQDRLLIVFGAMSMTDHVRKGYRELRQALDVVARSPLSSKVLAVVFGNNAPLLEDLRLPAVSLGHLQRDDALIAAYNCADLVVVPSLEDNLPNVALEAMACGAPVVGFDVCGMPDIVVDGWNGRLVTIEEPDGLGRVLVDLLSDPESLAVMRINAREHAFSRHSLEGQAQRYLHLYEQLVETRSKSTGRFCANGDFN
jgi:glycosyltransferase involved in cell wall biosynthesis